MNNDDTETETFEGLYRMSFSEGRLSLELGDQADSAVEIDFERAMVMIAEKIREHAEELWTSSVQTLAKKIAYQDAGLEWDEYENGN